MGVMDDATEEMYVKYSPELLRFAAALVGPANAEDVVSSAFVRTLSSPRWSEVAEHRAYLYRAVLNEARQGARSTRRRLARELAVARPDSTEPDALRVDVANAVAGLSIQQRAVVFLTYWFQMSAAETAATLDISQRSTERLLTSARFRLRRSLQ